MATGALASGHWTIGYPNGDRSVDTSYTTRKKIVNLKLTLQSGIMPLAGVPLPSAGSIGLVRSLDYYTMAPRLATASGHRVVYGLTTGHRLIARRSSLMSGTGTSLQNLATTFSNPSRIFFITAFGW